MADKTVDLGLNTGLDITDLKKGLKDAEKVIEESADKQTEIIEENAEKQTEKLLEEVKKQTESLLEEAEKQTEAILTEAEMRTEAIQAEAEKQTETVLSEAERQTEALKSEHEERLAELKRSTEGYIEAENEKQRALKQSGEITKKNIENIKAEAAQVKKIMQDDYKKREKIIKDSARKQTKEIQDNAKKQVKTIQDAAKQKQKAYQDMASNISRSITGIDFSKMATIGGTVALAIAALKKLKDTLSECGEMWREQEKAETALAAAARNNPYLNDRNVKQIKAFASELQRIAGIDNVAATQTATRLASLGRNQEQIQKIMNTAADMAAQGIMSFDEACNELNMSLNGMVRTSGRLYPELKKLSKEAMASGEAIEIIGKKVAGSAEEMMKTGAGSVTAYKNAQDDLKKAIGEFWDWWGRGARNIATKIMQWYTDGINLTTATLKHKKELAASKAYIEAIDEEIAALINKYETSEEYQRIFDARLQAEIDGNKELLNLYEEEMNAFLVKEAEAIGSLKMKKLSSSQYMTVLEEEIRMLNVIGMMRDKEKYQEGVHYSILERKRAEEYERVNNLIGASFGELEDIYNNILAKFDRAIEAQEIQSRGLSIEEQRIKAEEYRDENQKALEQEYERIIRNAELKGEITKRESAALRENINNEEILNRKTEIRKQILDANVNAYENLLKAAKDYLETLNDEQKTDFLGNDFENLKAQWAAYTKQAELEKTTDAERKRRLSELIKMQEDAQNSLGKIVDDLMGEKRILEEEKIQREIAKIKEENAKAGIDKQYAHELDKIRKNEAEKRKAIQDFHNQALKDFDERLALELQNAGNNEREKTRIKEKAEKDKKEIIENYNNSLLQLEENTAAREIQIEEEKNAAIEAAHSESLKKRDEEERASLQKRLSMAQEYLNAASSIINSISSIWNSVIDNQTEEALRQNDKRIQSEEERAENEEKIMKEAAKEKYKAELFAWNMNIQLAMAQMALAMMNAYAQGSLISPIAAGIQMGLAALVGGLNVAAVIAAKPQPPRFHTGGVIQGSGEQSVIGLGGEVINTNRQFQNQMKAIENLANMKGGGGTPIEQKITVNNTVSDQVSANVKYDPERIIIDITNKALADGRLDQGLLGQQNNSRGGIYTL